MVLDRLIEMGLDIISQFENNYYLMYVIRCCQVGSMLAFEPQVNCVRILPGAGFYISCLEITRKTESLLARVATIGCIVIKH